MMGRYDESIAFLEKFEPKDTTIYYELAVKYADYKKDIKKANEYLEKALQLFPNFLDGLELLSINHYELNNTEEALVVIKRYINLQPNYGLAYYLQGVYYSDLGLEFDAERSYMIAREKGYTWDEEEYEFDDEY